MAGYPFHNDYSYNNGREKYLSDSVLNNGKYFYYGLAIGCTFLPSIAIAVDGVAILPPGVEAAPSATANTTKNLLLAGVCAYTAKCGKDGVQHVVKSAAGKASGTPNAVAIGVCLVATGWCIGRLVDRSIDKLL